MCPHGNENYAVNKLIFMVFKREQKDELVFPSGYSTSCGWYWKLSQNLSERFLHSLVTPARLSSRILPQVHLLKPQKVISKLIYFRLHSTSNLTTWFFWTFIIHAVVLANICVTVGWATFLLGCLLSTFSPPFTVCFQEAFLYIKSRVKFQSRFLFWLSFDILSSHFWEWNYVLLWHMTCCAWRISRCLTGWLSCTVDISLWMLQMIALHCSTLSCQRHF